MKTPENRKALWEAWGGQREIGTLSSELSPGAGKARKILDNLGQ